MLIKNLMVVMGAVSALPAFAQATAQNAYISAVIGGVSVGGLVLVVGIYKLAQFAFVKMKAVGHAHVPQAADKAMELVNSHFRRVTVTPAKVVEPSEDCWSAALLEFESGERRPGLWARVFSEAQGVESGAKADYLRHRAAELEQERHARLLDQAGEANERAKHAELAHLSAAERAYALLPKGKCPNCDFTIPLSSESCPKCTATFGDGGWRPIPKPDKWQIRSNGTSFD